MFLDLCMALVMALLINLYSLISNTFKKIMIFICGLITIFTYFLNDCHVTFIGTMDFGIWIICIICWNMVIEYIIYKSKRNNTIKDK